MSQPKRFDFWMYQKPCEHFGIRATMQMEFSENGRCVSWDDYAALAAEVEHLKTRPTLANQYAEYATLAAENERLRKAGDAMAEFMECPTEYYPEYPLLQAWLAAKEGRGAK